MKVDLCCPAMGYGTPLSLFYPTYGGFANRTYEQLRHEALKPYAMDEDPKDAMKRLRLEREAREKAEEEEKQKKIDAASFNAGIQQMDPQLLKAGAIAVAGGLFIAFVMNLKK